MSKPCEALRAIEFHKLKQSIEKNAGLKPFWSGFKQALNSESLGGQVAGAAVATAATLGLGAGVYHGTEALRGLRHKLKKPKAFKAMIEFNPALGKKRDAKGVNAAFNSLYNLNPELAQDPLTAASFVENSINEQTSPTGASAALSPMLAQSLQRSRPPKSQLPIPITPVGAYRSLPEFSEGIKARHQRALQGEQLAARREDAETSFQRGLKQDLYRAQLRDQDLQFRTNKPEMPKP